MNNLDALSMIARQPSPSELHRDQSAGDLLQRVAIELQLWVRAKKQAGTVEGRRWLFTAVLSDGRQVVVHQLAANGHSLIKLEGQFFDGTPCMFMAHQHSIQFLACFIPVESPEPKGAEIGFHTGLKEIKIDPSA